MTLLGFWGFNDTSGAMDPPFTAGGGSYSNALARTGSNCWQLSTSADTFPLPVGKATVIFGASFYPSGAYGALDMIRFQEGSTIHCRVCADASGHLLIKGPANTTVATSTYAFPLNAYIDGLEVKVVIHDTTGSVIVKVGGATVVSFSGDTRNAGTGVVDNVGVLRGASTMRMDDAYLCDGVDATSTQGAPFNDFLGDVAVRPLIPTGAGASTQWTPSTGSNFQCVDDVNANTSDFVAASAASLTDLYAMTDIPTTDLPLAWHTAVYAAKSDAGTPPALKPVSRGASGTVVEESAVSLSTTYQRFIGNFRFLDPDGNALTAARVNAMQAGVRSA